MEKLILGSQSPARASVLRGQSRKFSVMVPRFNEKSIRESDPHRLTMLLAEGKANALLEEGFSDDAELLVTADQVVVWRDEIREKPRDRREAIQFLEGYSEEPPSTISALCLVNLKTRERGIATHRVKIVFKPLPRDLIERYAATESPFLCAGGFDIAHKLLVPYITSLEGGKLAEAHSSVLGFPIHLFNALEVLVTL